MTINNFAEHLDDNLSILSGRLRTGTFEYSPLLPHFEPKPDGGERVICVPTVRDRIVQRALLNFLTTQSGGRWAFDSPCSYGFIKNRDVAAAINKAKQLRASKRWAYKTDIASFFDAIPRDEMKATIKSKIRLPGIHSLLTSACDCEAAPANSTDAIRLKTRGILVGRGLRQGMPLSPYFSNVYLRDFDERIHAEKIDMVRYADDLIFFSETKEGCEAIHQLCSSELLKLRLEIHPIGTAGKTEIYSPDEAVEFLGVELAPSPQGYVFRISDKQMNQKRDRLFEMSNLSELLNQRITITKFVTRLRSKIDGWRSAYGYCDNYEEFKQKLENWRIHVIQSVLVKGLGLPEEKLNRASRQFLEISPLPETKRR